MKATSTEQTTVEKLRQPLDWVSAQEGADMLGISVATFLRKVEEGTLPQPSLVLGERNPRWNVKSLYDAMAGIASDKPVTSDDLSDRIGEMAL